MILIGLMKILRVISHEFSELYESYIFKLLSCNDHIFEVISLNGISVYIFSKLTTKLSILKNNKYIYHYLNNNLIKGTTLTDFSSFSKLIPANLYFLYRIKTNMVLLRFWLQFGKDTHNALNIYYKM